MGVVHHSRYFVWFEMGRIEFARRAMLDFKGMEKQRTYLPVIDAKCKYRKSALFDDEIIIRTSLEIPKMARLSFCYEIFRKQGHERLASGSTIHAILVEGKGLIIGMPEEMKNKISDFLYQLS